MLFYFCRFRFFPLQIVLFPYGDRISYDVLIFQMQFRYFFIAFGLKGYAVGMNLCDFHLAESLSDESQFACGCFRQVDNVAFGERSAVGHFHDDFLAVERVLHAQQCAERIFKVGAGHAVTVVAFPVAHFPPVQFVRVVGRFAGGLFLGGQQSCAYGQADAAADDSCQCHGRSVGPLCALAGGTAGRIWRKIGIFFQMAKQIRVFLFLLGVDAFLVRSCFDFIR